MKPRECQQKRRSSNSSSKPIPKDRDILARSVCFTQQQTTVFEGAPIVSGSAAVLLGNVDNDPRAEIEVAVGGIDGTMAVFKAGHPTMGAYLTASGAAYWYRSMVLNSCASTVAASCYKCNMTFVAVHSCSRFMCAVDKSCCARSSFDSPV